MRTKINEIGSEYWLDSNITNELLGSIVVPNWLQKTGKYVKLLLSGRTAIDFILSDIKQNHPIRSVYMPSYCCDSMLDPFLKYNIKIQFYDVLYDPHLGIKMCIDENMCCDIVFILSYFGYTTNDSNIVKHFKEKGSIIIEDCTHSIFNNSSISKLAHYSFASLRKWLGILSGAIIYKHCNFYSGEIQSAPSYVSLKYNAMKLKSMYLNSEVNVDKKLFLSLFNQFNIQLSCDYSNYSIDSYSNYILNNTDITSIKQQRRENASFLHKNLLEIKCVSPIFKRLAVDICPLFVPVLVKDGFRDQLVSFLRTNQIYCPIHWPMSIHLNPNKAMSYLYNHELSLLCDQRYNLDHMNTILSILRDFDNKYFNLL